MRTRREPATIGSAAEILRAVRNPRPTKGTTVYAASTACEPEARDIYRHTSYGMPPPPFNRRSCLTIHFPTFVFPADVTSSNRRWPAFNQVHEHQVQTGTKQGSPETCARSQLVCVVFHVHSAFCSVLTLQQTLPYMKRDYVQKDHAGYASVGKGYRRLDLRFQGCPRRCCRCHCRCCRRRHVYLTYSEGRTMRCRGRHTATFMRTLILRSYCVDTEV